MRPPSTNITCPNCGAPFGAILEQILDVGRDPTAKERLLAGRVNLIVCPHCGYRGVVGTPLMYHDPGKQTAIVYVPVELGLEQSASEKLIGEMTKIVMQSLPEDAPKGYLLQPKTALTMQGLLDQLLEADGITQEMMDAERRKVDLINEIAKASPDELEQILADNQALFDLTFLELLTAAAQVMTQREEARGSLRLLNVRSRLMETTEAGQELKAQEDAMREASKQLEALGEKITREAFVDLLIGAVDQPHKVNALATLGRNLLDYSTFQMITDRIGQTTNEEQKQALMAMRDRLLEINADYERQSQALLQRAADTLRMLLQSADIPGAIRSNLDRIDDLFLQVLQVNLDEARKSGNIEISGRLKQIRDEVLKLIQSSAPPEIRLINELLALGTDEESLEMLRNRREEVSEQLIEVMGTLAQQLQGAGNELVATRLMAIRTEAQKLLS